MALAVGILSMESNAGAKESSEVHRRRGLLKFRTAIRLLCGVGWQYKSNFVSNSDCPINTDCYISWQ